MNLPTLWALVSWPNSAGSTPNRKALRRCWSVRSFKIWISIAQQKKSGVAKLTVQCLQKRLARNSPTVKSARSSLAAACNGDTIENQCGVDPEGDAKTELRVRFTGASSLHGWRSGSPDFSFGWPAAAQGRMR